MGRYRWRVVAGWVGCPLSSGGARYAPDMGDTEEVKCLFPQVQWIHWSTVFVFRIARSPTGMYNTLRQQLIWESHQLSGRESIDITPTADCPGQIDNRIIGPVNDGIPSPISCRHRSN
jgi:hypothetical protein